MGDEKIPQASELANLAALAAMLDGDRALNLDAAALLLGIAPGTFRQLAAKPGFPRPARMGKRLTWRRRELLEWWDAERDRQHRAA
jgi:predicted DNA-binding transcriptional regulator AlpA